MVDWSSGLSPRAKSLIKEWEVSRKSADRPSSHDTFLLIAHVVSKRSHDARTQHGCVLVDQAGHIVATGYNGFIREIDDSILPNLEKDKYPFMLHSEHNAVLSCARQGKSTNGLICYNTGPPCLNCYQILWQAGISRIICGDKKSNMLQNEEYKAKIQILQTLLQGNLPIIQRSMNLDKFGELFGDIS